MDVFQSVLFGFEVALQPLNLAYCFFGVLIGTLVGVLPGLGPAAAIALLLPTTFKSTPVSGVIMLAGIYYGAIIRGSILGFFLGIIPGGGAIISSFASYAIEKKMSKHPEEFGKGAIAGVALIVGPS